MIDKFMSSQPDVEPVATCCSSKPLIDDKSDGSTGAVKRSFTPEPTDGKAKRKKLSTSERHHKENLERKDKFLDLFQKLIDKL